MADQPSKPPQITEIVPAIEGEASAIASANAPFIWFDFVTHHASVDGVVHITLEAFRRVAILGEARVDRVMVAHLRTTMPAAAALRNALNNALLLAEKPASETAQ